MRHFLTIIFILTASFSLTFAQEGASEGAAMSKEAEENASNQEAGSYARKSVSFIDAVWLLDKSVKDMPQEYASYLLKKIKDKIMMKRFDYNPLPESFISDFVDKANKMDKITIDKLAGLMDETLVPKILEIVDAQKEIRAQNLTTEQQRNSFYSDKAKEYGITGVELEKVMNSAYIFIPVAKNYIGAKKNKKYSMSMNVGILWYRISTKGEKPQAKLVVKKMTTSMGFAKIGKTYHYDGKKVDAKEFAFRSCAKNAARNLLVATQEMPEFRLSAQVIEVDGGKVGFELGSKEGLKVDDKYKIVEFMEEMDGSLTKEESGWVITSSVADTNSKEGYKSKAFTVAGDPVQGVVLSEYPRIPIDIFIKGKTFPYKNASEDKDGDWIDSLEVSGGYGFQVNAQYNIGSHFGVNQLFFDFGYGMGFGPAEGTAWVIGQGTSEIKAVSNMCFDFSLFKRFYMGRFALVLQPYFGIQQVALDAGEIDLGSTTYYYQLRNSGMGFGANASFEYAVSPAVNFGVGAGYQMYGKSEDWEFYSKTGTSGEWSDLNFTSGKEVELDHSGLSIMVYFTYSPPSLPFDPIDMLRGLM